MILHIKVVEAKDIPKMDIIGTADPFINLSYSKAQGTYETKVIKNTYNPVWNEEFHIAILDKVEGDIHFSLIDFDSAKKNDLISSRDFPVKSFKIGKVVDDWYEFHKAEKVEKPGQVHLIFHLALPCQLPFSEDRTLNPNVSFCKLKAQSLTPEEVQSFKAKFDSVDEDKDGSITLSETRAFFDKVGINPALAPIAFVLATKEANDTISLSEFQPFYTYLGDVEQDPINVFRIIFQKFDKDQSGYLDQKEVLDLIYFFGGVEWGEKDAQRFIQKHDDDRDGKLSFEELCLLLEDVLSNKKDLIIKEKQTRNNTLESNLKDTLALISQMKSESVKMQQKLEEAEQKLRELLQRK